MGLVKIEFEGIRGTTRSGKTAQLVSALTQGRPEPGTALFPSLILAANRDNRIDLANRLAAATGGDSSVRVYTPLGFCQGEVILFWPLILEHFQVRSQFPLILRPENEQFLAARLWKTQLEDLDWAWPGLSSQQVVRRILDLLQLSSLAGLSAAAREEYLTQGLPELSHWGQTQVQTCIQQWHKWCLQQALLPYSLILSLYYRQVLPHPLYQTKLLERFYGLFADDVDEYPAWIQGVMEVFQQAGRPCWISWNPQGSVRLGLGADPSLWIPLAESGQVTDCPPPEDNLAEELAEFVIASLDDPLAVTAVPESMVSIQTVTRAQLLRQITDVIIQAVRQGEVKPQEIAVIGPGLDAIARYVLQEILVKAEIPVQVLNEQRPLVNVPLVRVLLTLLPFIYPGLGRLLDRDRVAEMLAVFMPTIDPVRAGLIADHCFEPHPETPQLLPVTAFPRWDRLGYQATTAYTDFLTWLQTQQEQRLQRLLPSVTTLFDRAIQAYLWPQASRSAGQLAALRELLEATQRFWEIEDRLHPQVPSQDFTETLTDFIQLLQAGTITANPFPVQPIGYQSQAVTLATVFQYRSSRSVHRWQFWLDAGSPRWLTGTDSLYRAEIFLQNRSGQPWSAAELLQAQEERLRRILRDLLGRTTEQVFLCHSDLATNGQEQTGPLLSLINAANPRSSLDSPAESG